MKYELTFEQIREIFIAGGELEKQHIEFNMDERTEIDAPDLDKYLEVNKIEPCDTEVETLKKNLEVLQKEFDEMDAEFTAYRINLGEYKGE